MTSPSTTAGGAFNISRDGNTIVGYYDNGFFTPNHAVPEPASWVLVVVGLIFVRGPPRITI